MFPKNETGKRLSDMNDLEEYGIHRLTGEACGIGLRILCDLDPNGVAMLQEFLSIDLGDRNNSWNHQGKAGWKSIMLPYSIFADLMVYVLAKEFKYTVKVDWHTPWANAHYVEGFSLKEDYLDFRENANRLYVTDRRTPKEIEAGAEPRSHSCWRVFISSGTAGMRNQHVWSGRVE